MSVPRLTIPEAAFDASRYRSRPNAELVLFLLRLSRGTAAALVLFYIAGYFAIGPAMDLTASRRLDFLEACRTKLRGLFLLLISKVEYVPIVTRAAGGKYYADAICQTDFEEKRSDLGMGAVHAKLQQLRQLLDECQSFNITEMTHYTAVNFTLKDLQQNIDTKYFSQREMFAGKGGSTKGRPRNLAQEVKMDIRGIKGMYMSGQV